MGASNLNQDWRFIKQAHCSPEFVKAVIEEHFNQFPNSMMKVTVEIGELETVFTNPGIAKPVATEPEEEYGIPDKPGKNEPVETPKIDTPEEPEGGWRE